MSAKMIGSFSRGRGARLALFSLLALIACSDAACAGVVGGASSIMLSQGPCLYSEQLRTSVPERRKYLVQLAAVLGEAPARGSVEEMYGNIEPASYRSDAAYDASFFGVEEAPVRGESADLDPFSTNCMSCHDGAGAVSVTVNWRNNPDRLNALRQPHGTDHPIGMDYQGYVAARRGDYKPVSGLNNRMLFVNGRVGCLTCHDPLNPERKHLVMSDRNSALCTTCHGR